jgi:uncharacterized protein
MDTESSRALVLRFCSLLSERKLEPMFALLAEDGTWAGVGNPATFAYGGTRDKARSVELITAFLSGFSSFEFTVLSAIAEGGKVAIEASSQGRGPGRKSYANEYLLTFECKNNRITRIREFFDQLAVLHYADQEA